MPTLAFTLGIAFWPGWHGAGTTPRWAVLALIAVLGLWQLENVKINIGHWIGGALITACAATLMWSPAPMVTLGALVQLGVLAGLFVLAPGLDLDRFWCWLGWGVALSTPVALAQLAGFEANVPLLERWFPAMASPAGLFVNKTILAESAMLLLIPALYARRLWLSLALLPSTIITTSRGVWLGLGAGLFVYVWRRSHIASLALVLVIASATPFVVSFNQLSTNERLGIWRDTLAGATLAGNGYGTFQVDALRTAKAVDPFKKRNDYAHNNFLQLYYEVGLVGLVLGVALFAFAWLGRDECARLVLAAVTVQSFFNFPWQMPVAALVAALALGKLYSDLPGLRWAIADCRAVLPAWLANRETRS